MKNLLIAPVELIEVRVGILLEHVERGDVVLPEIVVVVAENADAEIGVVENESAEIANEWLNAVAGRNEIVIVGQVADMNFRECFLERVPFFFASCVTSVREIIRSGRQAGAEPGEGIAREREDERARGPGEPRARADRDRGHCFPLP